MQGQHRHHRHVTPNGRGLGWRPQLPDHRDLVFSTELTGDALPPKLDFEPMMPPIYDQGQLGSCTSNAIAAAVQYERMRQKIADAKRVPSRLMIYYDERVMEGTVSEDAGAEIRDGIKSVATIGVCFEDGADGWPYDPAKFTQRPPAACYSAAKKDRALRYMRVPQLAQQVRGAIAQGYPVVFGFTCYPELDSDEVARTGILPMPGRGQAPIGGHAVLAVGYDDATRMFKIRNSWGDRWGQKGYFQMPYEYLLRPDLASDLWAIQLVG